ncbi:MAG: tyrosine--tRNA ligase, partial [Parvularculaceae bacterium]
GGAEINEAKKTLATEATALLHGRKSAATAAETARQAFEEGAAAEGLPTVLVTRAALAAGIPLFAPFQETGLIASNSEGRRHIK